MNGKYFCGVCLDKHNEEARTAIQEDPEPVYARNRSQYQRYREQHRCVTCGKTLPEDRNKARCALCAHKCAVRSHERWMQEHGDDRPRGANR